MDNTINFYHYNTKYDYNYLKQLHIKDFDNDNVFMGRKFKKINNYEEFLLDHYTEDLVISNSENKLYDIVIYLVGYKCTLGGRYLNNTFDNNKVPKHELLKHLMKKKLKQVTNKKIKIVEVICNFHQFTKFKANDNDIVIFCDLVGIPNFDKLQRYYNDHRNMFTNMDEINNYINKPTNVCHGDHELHPHMYNYIVDRYIEKFKEMNIFDKETIKHKAFVNINYYNMFKQYAIRHNLPYNINEFDNENNTSDINKHDNTSDIINGFIEMNCNPMTNGHKYLITKAINYIKYVCPNGKLYVSIVSSNSLSKHSLDFKTRYNIVKNVCSKISNDIIVVPNDNMLIGDVFYGYRFANKNNEDCYKGGTDAMILFAKVLAPLLNIKYRFFGTEQNDITTNRYNEDAKKILPTYNINVVIIKRI